LDGVNDEQTTLQAYNTAQYNKQQPVQYDWRQSSQASGGVHKVKLVITHPRKELNRDVGVELTTHVTGKVTATGKVTTTAAKMDITAGTAISLDNHVSRQYIISLHL